MFTLICTDQDANAATIIGGDLWSRWIPFQVMTQRVNPTELRRRLKRERFASFHRS